MAEKEKQTNNEELLQLAIKAAKSGQKEGARVMFRQVYTNDKRNETAMMWLAKLAKTQQERVDWLQRILNVNPGNSAAQKALKRINYKREAADNRTLVLFGVVGIVMLVLVVVILVIVLT